MVHTQRLFTPKSFCIAFVLTLAALGAAAQPAAQPAGERATLRGTVTDPAAATVASARVTLRSLETGAPERETRTDPSGVFRFDALSPGRFALRLAAPGFAELEQEVVLVAGEQSLRFELALAPVREEVEVRETASWAVAQARSATKLPVEILQTPISVQTVSRAVMDDQQVVRVDDALENVSGVYLEEGQGLESFFTVRGFRAADVYRDGVKARAGRNIQGPRETVGLESIEVVKGPVSILYGRMEPGGFINLIPKQPAADASATFTQQVGSYDNFRSTLGLTGPVAARRDLLYRVDLAYEDAGSFRELRENRRFFVAPVLSWQPDEQTHVRFDVDYLDSDDAFDYGIPALGDRPAPLPRERNLGEAGARLESEELRAGLRVERRLGDRWRVAVRGDYDDLDLDAPAQAALSGLDLENCSATSCEMFRSLVATGGDGESTAAAVDLVGELATGSVRHTVLLGADYFKDRNFNRFAFSFFHPSIDIFNPVHTPVDPAALDAPDFSALGRLVDEWYGLYVQDQVALPSNVFLTLGARYDDATVDREDVSTFFGETFASDEHLADDQITPRLGILWQTRPHLGLYANYTESFGPANGRNADGSAVSPETAQQFEIGLKTELGSGKTIATVALYDLTQQNLALPDADPLRAAAGFVQAVGEVRNRGLEIDVAGTLVGGWRLIGSYSYIDSEITRDRVFTGDGFTTGNQGNRLYGVPKHGGSLWASWQRALVRSHHLQLGFGIVARSEREGDNANSFQLPGYAKLDAMLGYEWPLGGARVGFQLNVDNLLDEDYFTTSGSRDQGIGFGQPRSFIGQLRASW